MVNSKILPCAALAACLFVGLGCKGIAGISDRTLVEDTDGGVEGDAEVDAPIDTSCELPPPGSASIRLGNLIPTLDRVDFCIKPSDETFEGALPTVASWGGGCQLGLGYRDVTAMFGAKTGVFDVVAVQVDASTDKETVCSGTPIASATQVVVEEGGFLSLLLFGSGLNDAVLRAAPESRASSSNDSAIRFMHGLVGAGNLDCGMTLAADLPQQITNAGFSNVPFASGTTQSGQVPLGSIDANGYLTLSVGVATLSMGAAPAGSPDVLVVEANKFVRGVSYSMFALGREGDNRFPPEMYICDEQKADGILARCGGLAIDFRVDTFNAQLAGPYGPWDAERAPKMAETINGLDTDAVCVHEVWAKAHRDQIIAGTASTFPHSAMFDTDLDTVPGDPTDANGDTPPPYDQPACTGDPDYAGDGTPADPPSNAYLFYAAANCIRDKCFEPAGDDVNGRPVGGIGDCMTLQCLAPLLPLVGGSPEAKGCYACLFNSITSFESPEAMREACTTDPKARFVYHGSSATQVLSRYPIRDAEQWVLPATDWRVNVIRAPIELPNEAMVDLYCTQLTTPADGMARPYTGQYGNGKDGLEGWQNELYLQAGKLVAWVKAKSQAAGRMAVISGTFYSGPEYFDGETQVLESINETAYNTLLSQFPFAAPSDYVPSCTYCNDNPILAPPGASPTGANTRQSHIFLSGIPVTAIRSAEVVEYPLIVDLTSEDDTPFSAPATTHWGFRSTLRIVR